VGIGSSHDNSPRSSPLARGDDIEEKYPLLQVSRIDPKLETTRYSSEIIGMNADHLDQDGLELLKEDLASPCTEEIVVFRAFVRIVEEADRHRLQAPEFLTYCSPASLILNSNVNYFMIFQKNQFPVRDR